MLIVPTLVSPNSGSSRWGQFLPTAVLTLAVSITLLVSIPCEVFRREILVQASFPSTIQDDAQYELKAVLRNESKMDIHAGKGTEAKLHLS